MSEIAPAGGGGPNRLFVVLALGLAGLLVLGLIAIGGVLLIPRLLGGVVGTAPTTVRAATTPTRLIVLATTAASPTAAATDTVAPTPTLVNANVGGGTPGAEGTGTPTVIGAGTPSTSGTPGAGGALPSTGLGENLLLLAGGVVLVLIVFAARRARMA